MRYFVRFLVFITSVFFSTAMFAVVGANVLNLGERSGMAPYVAVWAFVGAFLGLCFSGVIMNMVCGKLPKEAS